MIIGLISILSFLFLTDVVLADCSTAPEKNYTECIRLNSESSDNITEILEQCSCCVVTASGSLPSLCPSLSSPCNKAIGVAIPRLKDIYLTGSPGFSISYVNSDCTDCCNVGLLINNQMEAKLEDSNITISGLTVKNWANGIMLWKLAGVTIKDSNIVENGKGIYTFNSKTNNIFSNHILGNGIGIYLESSNPPQGPPMSFNNSIYNNYFFNTINDVDFNEIHANFWNVSKKLGTNIIKDPYIGGNYWEDYAKTCTCTSEGFCESPFTLNPVNIDNLPLCKIPYIEISISGTVQDWLLEEGPNYHEGLSLYINTNAQDWRISAEESEINKPMHGYLVKYSKIYNIYDGTTYLHQPLMINASYGSYVTLESPITNFIVGSTPSEWDEYPIGLRQDAGLNDAVLPDGYTYRMKITFTTTIIS